MIRCALCLLACTLLWACSSMSRRQDDWNELTRIGIPSAVFNKITHDEDLTLDDIEELSRRRVPDGIIMRHIDSVHTIYNLRPADVARLNKNGVSPALITFLQDTYRREDPLEPHRISNPNSPFYDSIYGEPRRFPPRQ